MADIEKMFLQFLVREQDRKLLKLLWKIYGKITEFEWNTVTFGIKPAPYLAIMCLIQLAKDEGYRFPVAAKILKKDMYVDNLITGANTKGEARKIYEQMTNLLKCAKLNLRQWVSNDLSILEGVHEKSLDNEFIMNKDSILKALGVYWKAREDCFVYTAKLTETPTSITKRFILSEIAKLFDLLGLIGPIIITRCYLLCSKSRVAPLPSKKSKKRTIPQLELCGALLLAKLYKSVIESIIIAFERVVFWTDSTIVLGWLNMRPNLLKMFVANRVAEIQNKTEVKNWRHVRTQFNPADILSRGQLPLELLKNKLWNEGPSWLTKPESYWPKIESSLNLAPNEMPETKKECCLKLEININILERFFSFSKLKRIIAICYRCHPKYRQNKGNIKTNELDHAEQVILKLIQSLYFQDELYRLKKNKEIHRESRIRQLDPFIDENGLLRVGGRIKNASISFNRKHPIILPKSHLITDMIISYYHQTYCHAGVQTTLYAMRQKYWPIDGRTQIRKIIRRCVTCFRAKPILAGHKMGNLPTVRVEKGVRVFYNVGIDYCGPFYVKERKYYNKKRIKTYIALFICMSTKAVHIEVAHDLSTEAFLNTLRRFVSRRGKPKTIYCDNATNFQGAKNELNELYLLVKTQEFQNKIIHYSANFGIDIHFIPPSSPQFGGLWEAGVKSYKHHLKRVASNLLLSYEEFYTLSIEIDSILNSRPLCLYRPTLMIYLL